MKAKKAKLDEETFYFNGGVDVHCPVCNCLHYMSYGMYWKEDIEVEIKTEDRPTGVLMRLVNEDGVVMASYISQCPYAVTMRSEPVVDEEKYIVFKRNEFFEMMGKLALPPYSGKTTSGKVERAGAHWDCAVNAKEIEQTVKATELSDAVVIRRQDVFAAPALDAYANAILCALALAKGSSLEGASISNLEAVADYFHDQAMKSYDTPNRKMPD